jgi:hypothetical protein
MYISLTKSLLVNSHQFIHFQQVFCQVESCNYFKHRDFGSGTARAGIKNKSLLKLLGRKEMFVVQGFFCLRPTSK